VEYSPTGESLAANSNCRSAEDAADATIAPPPNLGADRVVMLHCLRASRRTAAGGVSAVQSCLDFSVVLSGVFDENCVVGLHIERYLEALFQRFGCSESVSSDRVGDRPFVFDVLKLLMDAEDAMCHHADRVVVNFLAMLDELMIFEDCVDFGLRKLIRRGGESAAATFAISVSVGELRISTQCRGDRLCCVALRGAYDISDLGSNESQALVVPTVLRHPHIVWVGGTVRCGLCSDACGGAPPRRPSGRNSPCRASCPAPSRREDNRTCERFRSSVDSPGVGRAWAAGAVPQRPSIVCGQVSGGQSGVWLRDDSPGVSLRRVCRSDVSADAGPELFVREFRWSSR